MTDKELIQAARICWRTVGCGRCELFNECPGRAAYLAMATNRLEALLAENERLKAQVPKWVSVEERLPDTELETATADEPDDLITCEISARVMVVDRTGEVRFARYELGPYFQGWQENGRAVGEVTHWMSLPEPPSTGGGVMRCTKIRCPIQHGHGEEPCTQTDCPYHTEPVTNAERIRDMTDEELAGYMAKMLADYTTGLSDGSYVPSDKVVCEMASELLRQLQQPYESPTVEKG